MRDGHRPLWNQCYDSEGNLITENLIDFTKNKLKEEYTSLQNNFDEYEKRNTDLVERNKALSLENVMTREGFKEDPIMVLMVHEAFTNPCSERWVIRNWFKDHGYFPEEFRFEGSGPR